jgi:hypothetical protein
MKKKITLLALCLFAILNSFGQKNLADVNKIKGFYVFVDSKPTSEYESLGEVKVDGNDAEVRKSPQYQSVRDNLIKNARAANYTADGLILTFVNGGVDKAEIIKFKESEKNKARAKVEQNQGVYIFIDCQPVSESDYIGTSKKSGGGFSSSQYTAVRDALIKKCKKDFKDFDAIIFKFIEGGADMADAVKLK